MKDTLSNNKRLCECGCGCKINRFSEWGYERRFKKGHHNSKERQWKWKGGRYISSHGYVCIKKPEHPNANCRGYVYEHILVMEQYLRRHLESFEDVHHINENKQDNRIENLQLLTHGQHSKLTHTKDMSMRRCVDCDRGEREIGRGWCRVGYQMFICVRCYMRRKSSLNKHD